MGQVKYYSLMIVPEGVEKPFGIRVKSWIFKVLVAAVVLLAVALIIIFTSYGRIMMRAADADRLEKENESLKLYKYKLALLEENMRDTRAVVSRIALLAGINLELPELPPDSVIFAELEEQMAENEDGQLEISRESFGGMPLKGYMTRGFSEGETDFHPGVDIAAAIGTPVYAIAGGTVTYAGYDSTYGLMVVLEHHDNVETVYGHNSELFVAVGSEVFAGTRIANSGNTGKSTAPHLHFEVRVNRKPVNPLKYIAEHEISNQ